MTTIVAKRYEDGVFFVSDSRVSGGPSNDNWVSKVVHNSDYTIGVAGHLKALQLLEFSNLPPVPKTGDLDRFVSVEVAPLIAEILDDVSAHFILAIRNEVYEMYDGGEWLKNADGNYAVGSGAKFALGALNAGATPERAVEIAAKYDPSTGGDIKSEFIRK